MEWEYEWDPDKRAANLEKHGVDFAIIVDFEWDTAVSRLQNRDRELRYGAIGYIGDRLHVVVYTMRGPIVRLVSLRKGGRRDRRDYAQA